MQAHFLRHDDKTVAGFSLLIFDDRNITKRDGKGKRFLKELHPQGRCFGALELLLHVPFHEIAETGHLEVFEILIVKNEGIQIIVRFCPFLLC